MSNSTPANQGNKPPQVPCYGRELLRRLRNEIPIDGLIRHLDWPHKQREGRFVFLCPICGEFLATVKRETNLGRCFPCKRNFNPIDFRMLVEREDFIGAVEFLIPLLPR
jgi:DNA primase